jgi:DNA-binding NtrC family response regulator
MGEQNSNGPRILVIEDDASLAQMITCALSEEGFSSVVTPNGTEALTLATDPSIGAVLCDLKLLGMNGLEVIQSLSTSLPQLPIILMTGHGSAEIAIRATMLGAFDYLTKPFEIDRMISLIRAALAQQQNSEKAARLESSAGTPHEIVGKSPSIQAVCKEIGRAARGKITVLIRGETGTGKELVARAIHRFSERADKAFVSVNCIAIPESLLESELFGHERGAFTGASARRLGRFELAHQGTLFLDEIGDISLPTQGKLLRALQERTIQRLGSECEQAVDVRVVAATHCDLEKAVRDERFRADLYYRLCGAVIKLPPLRDRKSDIPSMAGHFIQRFSRENHIAPPEIGVSAMQLLEEQPWDGNVRELESVVHRSILAARGGMITADVVREALQQSIEWKHAESAELKLCVSRLLEEADREDSDSIYDSLVGQFERELFLQAYERSDGNQSRIAKWLGVSRSTIHQKLRHYGMKS